MQCSVEYNKDGTDAAELSVPPGGATSPGGRHPRFGLSSQTAGALPLSHTLRYKQPAWVSPELTAGKLGADNSELWLLYLIQGIGSRLLLDVICSSGDHRSSVPFNLTLLWSPCEGPLPLLHSANYESHLILRHFSFSEKHIVCLF